MLIHSGAAGEAGCDGIKTGLEVLEVKLELEMGYSSAEMGYSSVEMGYSSVEMGYSCFPIRIIGPPLTLDGEVRKITLSLQIASDPFSPIPH